MENNLPRISRCGKQCAWLRQFPARFQETADTYCFDPTPAQRRHLAALFLAGGEPVSALVQWLRLPEAERHAGDGLHAGLVALLEGRKVGRGKRSEDTLIAAPLAAALGLERVYAMDDHTGFGPEPDQKA